MNPPSTSSVTARSTKTPPFRSFVSVELPFTLAPTTVRGLSTEEREQVEAFLPPAFVVDCVENAAPQRTSVRVNDTFAKRGRPPTRHASDDDESSGEDSGSRGSGSGDSAGSDNDEDDDDANRRDGRAPRRAAKKDGASNSGSSTQKPTVRLMTQHRRDYCTDPIFSGWRSTNWGDDALERETETTGEKPRGWEAAEEQHGVAADLGGDHLHSQRRRRREVFPSVEPQVLVNGYYRNDLLVQVHRTRRVRRYRDPETNAVLREEYVEDTAAEPSSTPALTTEVVGVVSRELELARPADFTFALFTPEQLRASPSLCGADFFPPAHYLSAKASSEVRYEPGKDANTSVRLAELNATDAAAAAALQLDVSGGPSDTPHDAQFDTAALPTISVSPEETTTAPPRRLAVHDSFLRAQLSSLDGSRDDDPPEVRMMVRLLSARPAWIVHDLMEAMLQSGLCPRTHRNKQVMMCFTYIIPTGPFNRLRLRFDFDPYASSLSAPYERVALRLHRRSDLGVRLRDVSRSPYVDSVLWLVLARDRARRAAYKAEPGHERRSTLLELHCRAIQAGLLAMPYQLIDAMDDAVIAGILANVPAVDTPMEVSRRGRRCGWVDEVAYTRAATHFADALETLLKEDVEPLLRKFKGEEDAALTLKKKAGQAPEPANVEEDDDEEDNGEDEDEDDDLSAMSSATAGDLSSDGEGGVSE